ncbi:hypothetical protein IV102_18135 [bacterium]|nr:hypothetical protein [bacterium]
MAESIMPICEGGRPKAPSLLPIYLQAERAQIEEELGDTQRAAQLREDALSSPRCPERLRQQLLEELVRDYFCLGRPDQARARAAELDEPLRAIYLDGARAKPDGENLWETPYHLLYMALSHPRPRKQRQFLSKFLQFQTAFSSRPWEIHRARQLALELCVGANGLYCANCYQTLTLEPSAGTGLCPDCWRQQLTGASHLGVLDAPLARHAQNWWRSWRHGHILPRTVEAPAPVEWSAEASRCLESGFSSLDLYRALRPWLDSEVAYRLSDEACTEPAGPDGRHSQGWVRAVEIAEWLVRWRRKRQPLTPRDLLLGLAWDSRGQASGRIRAPELVGKWMPLVRWELREVTNREVQRLHLMLEKDPSDVFSRAILLILHDSLIGPQCCIRNRQEVLRHSLWLLENCPDHPAANLISIGHDRGWATVRRRLVELLEEQPANMLQYVRVAGIYGRVDPRLARAILDGRHLDGDGLLELSSVCGAVGDWPAALQHARKALEYRKWKDRDWPLVHVVSALYGLKDWAELYVQAEQLWYGGGQNSWSTGRHLQGVAAFELGRVEESEKILRELGGQWWWCVRLASRLLRGGRRGVVLEYFEAQRKVRKGKERATVQTMIRQLQSGRLKWDHRFL